LANIKSAEKRARQAVKQRAHNMTLRSKMRTAVKNVRAAIATGEKATAQAAYRSAVPVIDSMVNKGIIHRNTAARHKSRLSALVKTLQ
jgi:small subunit ribosomal protein S20